MLLYMKIKKNYFISLKDRIVILELENEIFRR